LFVVSSGGLPSLSTDQLAAFAELARQGSLRAAAAELHITEQGLRNRLIALEDRLGIALYHKRRGVRRGQVLTEEGRRFLPHATALLDRLRQLGDLFTAEPSVQEVHVAASQYLAFYVLIDVVKRFHARYPAIRIRLSTRTEQQIEAAVRDDPDVTVGVAAPYEPSTETDFRLLFSMGWSLIARPGHPLLRRTRVRLRHLAAEPLILFERGSTGRQHVIDAFRRADLTPVVAMEVTTTQTIVRMVEAGLGVSIVPLLPDGSVTRRTRIEARSLGNQIAPIQSGILTRRGEAPSGPARLFVEFLRAYKGFAQT
jgi:DNA-binding transcriptional LysR family regulator